MCRVDEHKPKLRDPYAHSVVQSTRILRPQTGMAGGPQQIVDHPPEVMGGDLPLRCADVLQQFSVVGR
jgi:hypothetical protein